MPTARVPASLQCWILQCWDSTDDKFVIDMVSTSVPPERPRGVMKATHRTPVGSPKAGSSTQFLPSLRIKGSGGTHAAWQL